MSVPCSDTVRPAETLSAAELETRHERCRAMLAECVPGAAGIMTFSRINIYYLTGVLANGVFWLPLEGEPVLLLRRGLERARMESSLARIDCFKSYGDVPARLADAGSPLPESAPVAAEMNGLSWSLSNLLRNKLSGVDFVPGDMALALARSVKTEYEIAKMRICGARHHQSLFRDLPERLRPGMSEREISHAAWEVFFSHGHSGHMRMSGDGEIYLGHVAAGPTANYPSVFDGPVGLLGEHPAVPFMGYAGKIWQGDEPLTVDIGFSLEGYVTDKTQVYWPGDRDSMPSTVSKAHQCCIDIQDRAAEMMRPGALPSELYAAAMDMAHNAGFDEGFMALAPNKVAFLGHGIGLCVDEYPALAKGFDRPFEEHMAIALEPKIGIPGVGMVGVENTFEVTKHGGECITGDCFEIVCLGE